MKGDELNKYHLHMHVYSRHIALLRALRTLNLPLKVRLRPGGKEQMYIGSLYSACIMYYVL